MYASTFQVMIINDTPRNRLKLFQHRPQVLRDGPRQFVGFGQVLGIFKALVLEPEDIQIGLVALDQLLVVVSPPATFRVRLAPGGFTVQPGQHAGPGRMIRVAQGGHVRRRNMEVAGDEIVQMFPPQGLGLQREMHIGAEVIDPQLVGPRRLAGRLGVEKQHIRLDALGVKNARGQAQQGVDVVILQQLEPDGLARPTLEQHVIRDDNRAAAIHLQQRGHMLEKIELLVLGRHPEAITLIGMILLFEVALLVDDGKAAFLAEGRIGQHQAEFLAGVLGQAIDADLNRADIGIDAMQQQIHDGQAPGGRDQLHALHEPGPQMPFLVHIHG